MQAYQIVQRARQLDRISTLEVIDSLCSDFIELHGDRLMADDKAMVAGIGLVENKPITVVGIQKGRHTKENIMRNFGSSGPAGYRKAIRQMKLAEKFGRPVLTLINTAGAHAAPESEENGIGDAIAQSLITMSELTVPTLSIILGEGGSGGAIALALTDSVWMMENSIYSILSPEGFASILWKDSKLASQAADVMKLTAKDLLELKVIDKIIPEEENGIFIEKNQLLNNLTQAIKSEFSRLMAIDSEQRHEMKYARFRQF
ncbi:carboxyltransferase subunit alpha [Fundicoccus culcitae]|uniref:Acetyl-CoA carboxylase carboxyl transferase subunit alpha n=1 Tax=Fundicoccus culcitae TaxID=2969821 RepID=A0ABY5P6A3_9LACT|nr:carboxyltransferase subunit alpha [Fundicoccus culcitae]UUX34271.1 acetyl-CoA carboxylase carboxyl transferase subunit alpha [Fundicoccus culcitae]